MNPQRSDCRNRNGWVSRCIRCHQTLPDGGQWGWFDVRHGEHGDHGPLCHPTAVYAAASGRADCFVLWTQRGNGWSA